MNKQIAKQEGKERRHNRVRAKVVGTTARPRLAVYKSNRYLHAQIIDDMVGKTLVAGTTQPAKKIAAAKKLKKSEAADKLGESLAKQAIALGITAVVFDRGGFRYTGRVAQLAESARKGGLTF
ncbi:MAG: 50S ribosomal protein L18 [bacterium]